MAERGLQGHRLRDFNRIGQRHGLAGQMGRRLLGLGLVARVRLFGSAAGPPGVCPADASADRQTHSVEFWIGRPDATVTAAAVMPEPGAWAL